MSKIYQPSMTADDVFKMFQSEPAYRAKVGELQGMLKQVNTRVGLVKTQGEADKLLAQAESKMGQAKADALAARDDRLDLLEEKTAFADEMDAERSEVVKIRKKANARSTSVAAKEKRVNKELDERETRVAAREAKIASIEEDQSADSTAINRRSQAFRKCLDTARGGLEAI